MGDILLATPLIRWLRRKFPQSQIDFAVKEKFAALLYNNPHINNILILKEPGGRQELIKLKHEVSDNNYNLIADIHSNFRSHYLCAGRKAEIRRFRLPRLRRWALVNFKCNSLRNAPPVPLRYLEAVKNLGVIDDGGGLEFYPSEEDEASAESMVNSIGFQHEGLTAIAPGAKWFTKQWLPDKFIGLGKRIRLETRHGILLLGSRNETVLCSYIANGIGEGVLNLAGGTTFGQAGALMKKCRAFIGNDSGLGHLAAAAGTRSVIIFGPTVKEFGFFPFKADSIVVEKDIYCKPCSHIGGVKCPEKHFRCMKEIEVKEVFGALEEIL